MGILPGGIPIYEQLWIINSGELFKRKRSPETLMQLIRKRKKLTDIGFCLWFSMELEFHSRTVLKDIGRLRGSILYQSTCPKDNSQPGVHKSSNSRFDAFGIYGTDSKIPVHP